jgi:hypothetical protein
MNHHTKNNFGKHFLLSFFANPKVQKINFTAFHGISRHFTAFHGISRHFTAFHGISRHFTAFHGISRHYF